VLRQRYRVRLPADARPTEPYFLREPRAGELYRWPDDPAVRGLPFEPPAVRGRAVVELAGAALELEREAEYRGVDPREGEVRRPVLVVPAVSVALEPAVAVLPLNGGGDRTAQPLRFGVRLRAEGDEVAEGDVALELPPGWRAAPASERVRLAPGEARVVAFEVAAPAGVAAGRHRVGARFTAADGRRHDRALQLVDYPHIRPRPLLRAAESAVSAFELRVPAGLVVGYIMGAGDEVPQALAQLGIDVELLDAAALAGDLSRFDVIVTGIRAYEVRPELAALNRRLLDWVAGGGTLIVQYNKYELVEGGFPPYPLSMARPHGRVADETAPVRFLEPASPVLTTPNRITAADFDGLVQERGLYFADTWDERYRPVLEMADPGEPGLRGALLVARHGNGTYVYTGLAFFRQLPEGVPGAYRLFANLLALARR